MTDDADTQNRPLLPRSELLEIMDFAPVRAPAIGQMSEHGKAYQQECTILRHLQRGFGRVWPVGK